MKIVNERSEIRDWVGFYRRILADIDSPEKAPATAKRAALDPETATAEDISALMKQKWEAFIRCDECKENAPFAVEVGEQPDYESATARLCISCLKKALVMAEESAQSAEGSAQHTEGSTQHATSA